MKELLTQSEVYSDLIICISQEDNHVPICLEQKIKYHRRSCYIYHNYSSEPLVHCYIYFPDLQLKICNNRVWCSTNGENVFLSIIDPNYDKAAYSHKCTVQPCSNDSKVFRDICYKELFSLTFEIKVNLYSHYYKKLNQSSNCQLRLRQSFLSSELFLFAVIYLPFLLLGTFYY